MSSTNDLIPRKMSRRRFIKTGVGIGVATTTGAILPLTGCSSTAQPTEGPQTDEQARFTAEQLAKIGQPHPYSAVAYEPIDGTDPIPPINVPEKWDYEADVVIVGCGGGGLAASVKCAEAGLRVIAIDKIEEAGGACTKESSCFMSYGGTKVQNAINFALPVFPYDPDALVQMWLEQDPTIDIPLAKKYAVKIPETNDWMGDHGVPWEMCADFGSMAALFLMWEGTVKDGFFPRAMHKTTDHMHAVAEKAGAQFFFKTFVCGLIKDGDAIVGVKALDIDNNEIYFHAKQAVILTSGGFASNPKMLQKYCPTAYRGAASSKLPPADTGEVIRMGLGAGADLIGFDTWGAFDGGIDAYAEGLGAFSHYLYSGDNQLSRQPWLTIDKTGARQIYLPFIPDSFHSSGIYTQFGGLNLPKIQAARQGGRVYVIFDANYETNIFKLNSTGCRIPITPDMPNIERLPEWLAPHDWRQGVTKALDSGAIKKADTLDELADLLGLNRDIFTKAVENWNNVCERGEDPEYGYEPNWLIPISQPPFYGIRIGAQMGQTHCGLHINTDFQVIDTDGLPIQGLYAGTHTCGGTQSFGVANSGSWTGGYCAAEGVIKTVKGNA